MWYEIYKTGFFWVTSPLNTLKELEQTYTNFEYRINDYSFTPWISSITVDFHHMPQDKIDKAIAIIRSRGFQVKEVPFKKLEL